MASTLGPPGTPFADGAPGLPGYDSESEEIEETDVYKATSTNDLVVQRRLKLFKHKASWFSQQALWLTSRDWGLVGSCLFDGAPLDGASLSIATLCF